MYFSLVCCSHTVCIRATYIHIGATTHKQTWGHELIHTSHLLASGIKRRSQRNCQLQDPPLLLMSTRQHVTIVWHSFPQRLAGMQKLCHLRPQHSIKYPFISLLPQKLHSKKKKNSNKNNLSISSEISMMELHNSSTCIAICFLS